MTPLGKIAFAIASAIIIITFVRIIVTIIKDHKKK